MRVVNIAAAWFACAAIALTAFAQDPDAPEASQPTGPDFNYQSGDITLPNKVATLHLGEKYRYLDPGETSKLLMAWGNAGDTTTQGAIVPAAVDPMDVNGWAVILDYKDEGHIDDAGAAEIDYAEMLEEMKGATEENNDARKQAGMEAVHLIGWAEPPRYDAATKKLYWAKELDFEGSPAHTLNYDVRVLGREGVLSMNAIASMDQLQQIRTDMRPLIEVAAFNEGYRYAEFDAKTDRMAEYGLGALIAGTVAAKAGLFGKLLAILVGLKKFIIIGLIAVGALIARLFGKKKDETV